MVQRSAKKKKSVKASSRLDIINVRCRKNSKTQDAQTRKRGKLGW